VQTLVYLSPLDEARSLDAVARSVGPSGLPYTGEGLAGDVVVPYLVRLLAERRDLVLHDAAGLASLRSLLAAFAAAGNEPALSLAYDFADVFR